MKVLFLTNMYPPHVIGGYEALCQEAVEGFARRGHQVSVLTSTYGYNREFSEGNIHRLLSLEGDLQFYKMKDAWTYPQRRQRNLDHLRRLIASEKPDIVFVWGMWNLSKSLAREAEMLMGSRVVYYLANPWPIEANMHQQFWDAPATSFVFKQVIPSILEYAPQAVLLIATNPVDVMTHLAARYAGEAGVPSSRVIGSGTTLDTARFRALVGRKLSVDSQHIHAYVLGEHGDSEVLPWSLVTVGGIPLAEFCTGPEISICEDDYEAIDEKVRRAAYHIIEGKGATYYGIGSAIARITEVILQDERSILTVCTLRRMLSG